MLREGMVTRWRRRRLHGQKLVLKTIEVVELSRRDLLLRVSSWTRMTSRRCVV